MKDDRDKFQILITEWLNVSRSSVLPWRDAAKESLNAAKMGELEDDRIKAVLDMMRWLTLAGHSSRNSPERDEMLDIDQYTELLGQFRTSGERESERWQELINQIKLLRVSFRDIQADIRRLKSKMTLWRTIFHVVTVGVLILALFGGGDGKAGID